MGKFAEAVKAKQKEKLCVIGRFVDSAEFDTSDRNAFLALMKDRQWSLLATLTNSGAAATRKHGYGLCICQPDAIGRGVAVDG